jgi:aspartate/methionine/tyrosine aminotransferase
MGKKALDESLQNSIFFDSLSKKFGLADWRVGWAIIVNKKIRERIQPFISYRGSVSGIMQVAAEKLIKKLSKNNFTLEKEVNKLYSKKASDLYQGLKSMSDIGVKVYYPPEGSIYMIGRLPMKSFDLLRFSLANPKDKSLKTTFVPMTTPDGSFFPDPALGENLFRFCFGIPRDQISQALALLRNQIESYKNIDIMPT